MTFFLKFLGKYYMSLTMCFTWLHMEFYCKIIVFNIYKTSFISTLRTAYFVNFYVFLILKNVVYFIFLYTLSRQALNLLKCGEQTTPSATPILAVTAATSPITDILATDRIREAAPLIVSPIRGLRVKWRPLE